MDKQGTLYLKLLSAVLGVVLLLYGLHRLHKPEASYRLQSTQISEVGDGITVSGFVVRYESLLTCDEPLSFLCEDGQWVGGGQAVAALDGGSLVVPRGGYVSHSADGYEDLLTPDFVLSCEGEELEALCPRLLPDDAVGRLIRGQSWYFAAPGDYPILEQGDNLRLSVGDVECKARVLRTQGILLLECAEYMHRITNLRKCEARLTTGTLTAIPLPGRAVYYEEGKTCVYILRGAQVRRQTVEILRTEEDRVWISPETLGQGEQVILTEQELSDGMILK